MLARAAEHLDDAPELLVLSDALMERGDPRGQLISFMLEEERASELMRKVKVNVLIRDHRAHWAPEGARITGFRRGFPVDLEWHAPTDPLHLAWSAARSIHVTLDRVPQRSVFSVARPQLKKATGLSRVLLSHVLGAAPANLEVIDGQIHTVELNDLARALPRLPKLRLATLRSTVGTFDDQLSEARLRSFLSEVRGLTGVRLSLPRLPFSVLDRCLALVPKLNVQFVVLAGDREQQMHSFTLDPRRRWLWAPPGNASYSQRDALNRLPEALAPVLGELLYVVESREAPERTG